MKRIFLLIFYLSFAGVVQAQSEGVTQTSASETYPSLISCIRIKSPVEFCGEPVPLDDMELKERFERELLLYLDDQAQVILWLKRASRYMPFIEKVLKEYGIPEDMKYVPIVESALLPHIGSSKNAVGYWQFMSFTGVKFGLRIDDNIDERRNIFTSTRAAAKYLKALFNELGSWTLAAAAYNSGETVIKQRIEIEKTKDFYRLYLPTETQRHVFRLISAKLIIIQPEKYGFYLTPDDLYRPPEFDTVKIQLVKDMPIQLIAEASQTYFKTIKDLNPEIKGDQLIKGTYDISIPKGKSQIFYSRFSRIQAQSDLSQNAQTKQNSDILNDQSNAQSLKREESKQSLSDDERSIYIVKSGDSFKSIAKKHNITLKQLLIWNQIDYKHAVIHPGDRLIIYLKNR